ncbi:MAG: SDR family NAD(P)-dependent oxidoreductase [Acidobacteriota bacterium]
MSEAPHGRNGWALVAGAGPGLGQALLQRFDRGQLHAVGVTRSAADSGFESHRCDLSDGAKAADLLGRLIESYGPPKIVAHNTAQLVIQPFLETTPTEFEQCWRSMVLSAVHVAQGVLQPMVRAGGGSFLVSGATASIRGGARFAAFAQAKFALRGLTQSLAREFQPAGVHVAHVLLDGIIDSPRSRELHTLDPSKMIDPDDLAEAYWQLARQPSTTWTHELDLRPRTESF